MGKVFGDLTIAAAMTDRLVHHAEVPPPKTLTELGRKTSTPCLARNLQQFTVVEHKWPTRKRAKLAHFYKRVDTVDVAAQSPCSGLRPPVFSHIEGLSKRELTKAKGSLPQSYDSDFH